VNITINGYEWLIPDLHDAESRRKWRDADGAALIGKVNEIAHRSRWQSEDGRTFLGGETKFGDCLISARVTGYTHLAADGTETEYVPCDGCGADIPAHGGVRHQLLGPGGIEELCENCHEAEIAKELSR